MKEKPYVPTQSLMEALQAHENFEEFAELHQDSLGFDSFKTTLRKYFACCDYDIQELIRMTKLNPAYAYQIINGTRMPSRDKIIQLCLGLALKLEDVNKMLHSAEKQALYPKLPRDAIFIFAFLHELDVESANALLLEREMTPFY